MWVGVGRGRRGGAARHAAPIAASGHGEQDGREQDDGGAGDEQVVPGVEPADEGGIQEEDGEDVEADGDRDREHRPDLADAMVPLCVRGVASPPVETGAGGDDRGEQGDVAVAPDQPALPVDVQDLRRRNGEVGPPHPDGQPDAGGPEEHDVGAAPADLLGRRERRHRADDAFTEGDDGEEDGDPQKGRREVEGQEGEDDSTRLRKNDCRGVGSASGASLRRLARGPQPLGRYRTHHDIAEHHDLAVDLATRDDR